MAWSWKSNFETSSEPSQANAASTVANEKQISAFPNPMTQPSTSSEREPASEELNALVDMSRSLFQYTRPESQIEDLIRYLETSRQQPQIFRDSNEQTGDLLIVRTRSPLPGTRYFHAQYFSDKNDQHFLQHMSFEFRPGDKSLPSVIASLQSTFSGLPAPKIKKEGYVQWDAGHGYILWAKKMELADLQDDPFNSYTLDDAGTIRVAIELEIHDDAGPHDH